VLQAANVVEMQHIKLTAPNIWHTAVTSACGTPSSACVQTYIAKAGYVQFYMFDD
jgi:hypothetical protein